MNALKPAVVVGDPAGSWVAETTAALRGRMEVVITADPRNVPASVASAELCLIDAHLPDPLLAAAHAWASCPSAVVLLCGSDIEPDVRNAAREAGVLIADTRTDAALFAWIDAAKELSGHGSRDQVGTMCTAMARLSALVSSSSGERFIEAAVDHVRDIFHADSVSVLLTDDEGALRLMAHRGLTIDATSRPRQTGIAERVLESGQSHIILRNISGGRTRDVSASMCVPIFVSASTESSESRGVLNITKSRRWAIYTPRDLELAQLIAGMLGNALLAIQSRSRSEALEHRLAAVEHFGTIGEVAAGIAHDVANPLASVRSNVNAIRSYVGELAPVLADAADERPELRELLADLPVVLDETLEGLTRADQVVRQVKSLVRLNRPSAHDERVNLQDVVHDTLRMLRPRLMNTHVHVSADEDAVVFGDSVELTQVLVNLVANASDACEERRVREDGHEPAIDIGVQHRGKQLVLTVADNGTGMPPEVQARIFMPLYTTKGDGRGTGLGLSIVRRLIDAHGGSVRVASTPQMGTCFTVTLPAIASAPEDIDARRTVRMRPDHGTQPPQL